MTPPKDNPGGGRVKLTEAQQHVVDGLRRCRESRGLSLSAAARAAGITKAHLHLMEAGRSLNPCVSTLTGLAAAYHLPIGWLAEQFSAPFLTPAGRAALDPDPDNVKKDERT